MGPTSESEAYIGKTRPQKKKLVEVWSLMRIEGQKTHITDPMSYQVPHISVGGQYASSSSYLQLE